MYKTPFCQSMGIMGSSMTPLSDVVPGSDGVSGCAGTSSASGGIMPASISADVPGSSAAAELFPAAVVTADSVEAAVVSFSGADPVVSAAVEVAAAVVSAAVEAVVVVVSDEEEGFELPPLPPLQPVSIRAAANNTGNVLFIIYSSKFIRPL
jgi:hypothetical protein